MIDYLLKMRVPSLEIKQMFEKFLKQKEIIINNLVIKLYQIITQIK
jgi:hypothetical protein